MVDFNYATNSLQLYPQNSVFISVNSLPGIFCSGAETLGVTATTLGTKSISFIMLRDGILFHLLLSHMPTLGLKLSSTFSINASAPGQAYQLEDLLHLNGLDSSDSCTRVYSASSKILVDSEDCGNIRFLIHPESTASASLTFLNEMETETDTSWSSLICLAQEPKLEANVS